VRLIAIDSPCELAGPGGHRRDAERRLAREVCGIRYTPSRVDLDRQKGGPSPRFYDWIEEGLALYGALRRAGFDGRVIECFPTASWTRWAGPRQGLSRASWSARALAGLALAGVPPRLGQDARDAIAAAVTAREHEDRNTDRFGDIVVPRGSRPCPSTGSASSSPSTTWDGSARRRAGG
jgi:hypothetical protein